MLAKALSYGIAGIDGFPVQVEANVTGGMPFFEVVGLPDAAVKESRERVRAALGNSGFLMPVARIVVNLAPANVRKAGPVYDLPIALALLAASAQITTECLEGPLFIGELSLDGALKPVRGALSIVIAAQAHGVRDLVLPMENAREAACVDGVRIFAAESLRAVVEHLRGTQCIEPQAQEAYATLCAQAESAHDLSLVHGQHGVKRALEVAAAGGHNLLMVGPPGAGKTMLARCLPGILPDMTFEEALEVTRIHSVAGTLPAGAQLMTVRPFRAPHHTASTASLVGGGKDAHAGEITLAHHGVLFLDELPEFNKAALEGLRQPLEDGFVSITRALERQVYPSKVMLIAAMNPCKCGHYGDNSGRCRCTPKSIQEYLQHISGPLLDRIDLRVEVEAVPVSALSQARAEEDSKTVSARVNAARLRQQKRYGGSGTSANAHLNNRQIQEFCRLAPDADRLLKLAMDRYRLSMRAYFRVLKVARTIADLEDQPDIGQGHVAEALQYRAIDAKYWGG